MNRKEYKEKLTSERVEEGLKELNSLSLKEKARAIYLLESAGILRKDVFKLKKYAMEKFLDWFSR